MIVVNTINGSSYVIDANESEERIDRFIDKIGEDIALALSVNCKNHRSCTTFFNMKYVVSVEVRR